VYNPEKRRQEVFFDHEYHTLIDLHSFLFCIRCFDYRLFRYSLALMPVSFLNTRAKWAESW
jgi:hypothetical protein